jgi:hypothetical protein
MVVGKAIILFSNAIAIEFTLSTYKHEELLCGVLNSREIFLLEGSGGI